MAFFAFSEIFADLDHPIRFLMQGTVKMRVFACCAAAIVFLAQCAVAEDDKGVFTASIFRKGPIATPSLQDMLECGVFAAKYFHKRHFGCAPVLVLLALES